MMEIKFGTDGWRAIIAKDYTFENLNKVSQATARWILADDVTKNGVIIGHDARFMGREFAEHVATVFAAMGLDVRVADRIATAPALSWAALNYEAVSIVITASHNPPNYNGFKIKSPFGGSASPDQIAAIERYLTDYNEKLNLKPFDKYKETGGISEIPLGDQFLDVLRERIDLEAIRTSGVRIAHDSMFGAGQGVIKALLPKQTLEINAEFNPSFQGRAPEPIEKNLKKLSSLVVEKKCSIGIANDGDADRIGLYDEKGHFVDSHLALSLLTKYLNREKGLTGSIIKTFSTTSMLNKQAQQYGLPIETTKIGFKYIAEKIITGDVLVGGEESGGLAVKGHIPERDGIYIGLLITEMMVKSGKPLSAMVQDLFDEFGPHYNRRIDLHTTDEKKNKMIAHCQTKQVDQINGKKVIKWEFTDGIKHWMENGSWVLVRPSGTEPVLRIYSEDETPEAALANVEFVSKLV